MPKRGKRSNREPIRRTSKNRNVSETVRRTSNNPNVSQDVKQIVNVKVGGEVRRKRTGRKYRRKVQAEPQQIAAPTQMPIVSYQTGYGSFPLIQGTFSQPTQPSAPSNLMPSSIMQPSGPNAILEDIGLSRSQIIEVPTKREQLAEMITPVRVPSMEDESAPILFPQKKDEQPSLIPRFGEFIFPPEIGVKPSMESMPPPKMQFEFPAEISNYTLKGTQPISREFGIVEEFLKRYPEKETINLRTGKTIKVPKERLMQKPPPEEEEESNVQIVATQSMDKFLEAFKQPKLTASSLLGLPVEKESETVASGQTTGASPISSLTEELYYAGKKPKTPTKEQITRNIPPLETYGFAMGKSKGGNIVITDEAVVPVVYEKYKPPSEMNKEELIKRYTELFGDAPTKDLQGVNRYMREFIMDEEQRRGIA